MTAWDSFQGCKFCLLVSWEQKHSELRFQRDSLKADSLEVNFQIISTNVSLLISSKTASQKKTKKSPLLLQSSKQHVKFPSSFGGLFWSFNRKASAPEEIKHLPTALKLSPRPLQFHGDCVRRLDGWSVRACHSQLGDLPSEPSPSPPPLRALLQH